MPDPSTLWELFDYKPLTGELIRKFKSGAEKVVGSKNNYGHFILSISNVRYPNHRVIWKWMTGEDPGVMEVDHIDRNRSNNSWINLRLANRSQQQRIRQGSKGAYLRVLKGGRSVFDARIALDGKQQYLGTFKTFEEAHAVYVKTHVALHGEFSPYYKEFNGKV